MNGKIERLSQGGPILGKSGIPSEDPANPRVDYVLNLEPDVEMADQGDLTDAQVKQVLELTKTYREQLLKQWSTFKKGEKVKIRKI